MAETINFSLPELIDLALCSPEVGAVNFNILRILLHELLRKLGYSQEPARLDDLQAHQIQNFQNYIQGAGTASPMPGVLRYNPGGAGGGVPGGPGGHQFSATAETPRTPKSQGSAHPDPAQPARRQSSLKEDAGTQHVPKGFVGEPNRFVQSGPQGTQVGPGKAHHSARPASDNSQLEAKVSRLEQHLEALYALPTNQQILGGDKDQVQGMSVNDMWQIIQLNNRVAAAEAAIQKIASLIEDLAKEMKTVKADGVSSRKESLKVDPLAERVNEAQKAMELMKKELESVKTQTKNEMERLQKATGVDISKAPSFMKVGPKPAGQQTAGQQATGKPAAAPQNQGQGGQKQQGGPPPSAQKQQGQDQGVQRQGQPASGQGQAQAQNQPGGQSGESQAKSQAQSQTQPNQASQPGSGQTGTGQPGSGQPGSGQPGSAQPGSGQSGSGQPGPAPAQGQKQPSLVGEDGVVLPGGQGQSQRQGQPIGSQPGESQLGPEETQAGQFPSEQSGQSQSTQRGPYSGQPSGHMATPREGVGQFGDLTPEQYAAGQMIPGAQETVQPATSQKRAPSPIQTSRAPVPAQGQQAQEQQRPQQVQSPVGPSPASVPPQRQSFPVKGQPAPLPPSPGFDTNEMFKPDTGTSGPPAEPQGSPKGRKPAPGKFPARPPQASSIDSHGTAHGGPADVSTSHPSARHQGKSPIPVDVSNLPLTGVVHQEHSSAFKDYSSLAPPAPAIDDNYDFDPSDGPTEIVQKELQSQYAKLQGMQRQMAAEIQDKMEFIYQKLLREIATQHLTTSPYMAVGVNAEKCLGPGVCAGHGMPADTAVCQFPQAPQEKYDVPCIGVGQGARGKEAPREGGAVCPGADVCPSCKGDILHHLRPAPAKKEFVERGLEQPKSGRTGRSSSTENLLRQGTTSMVLLPRDLDDLREQVKNDGQVPDFFSEVDVLEKLAVLWEAVNVMKSNEESMAVRLVKQDAILQKVPVEAMEKIKGISPENLEALASAAAADNPFVAQSLSGTKSGGPALEDLQMIFNNLSNLVIESSTLKDKVERFGDALREIETTMVSKPMLVDAMSDKADRGQMNMKVSYDEFGNAVDELTARIQNLLVEVYQKNEMWKELTEGLGETLGEKLDKSELSPLRAYFKNHLNKLQEKVIHLTQLVEEPDPAGTRKKLLKDYNCISCDRYTSISGMTNGPTLPLLGPILAGHTTGSQRAFELHRMRQKNSRYDTDGQNYIMAEKQGRAARAEATRATYASRAGTAGGKQTLQDVDVLNLVNRYVGGSHTAVSNKERVSIFHTRRPSTGIGAYNAAEPEDPPARAVTSFYDDEEEE